MSLNQYIRSRIAANFPLLPEKRQYHAKFKEIIRFVLQLWCVTYKQREQPCGVNSRVEIPTPESPGGQPPTNKIDGQ